MAKEKVDDLDKSASLVVGTTPRRSTSWLDARPASHFVADMDDLPYELHTDRELEFMLHRRKPFAHFCDEYPAEPCEEIIPEAAFAPFVAKGIFEKREFVEPLSGPPPADHPHIKGVRCVLYAHPYDAWLIEAYIMLRAAAAKSGWSDRKTARCFGIQKTTRLGGRAPSKRSGDLSNQITRITPNELAVRAIEGSRLRWAKERVDDLDKSA